MSRGWGGDPRPGLDRAAAQAQVRDELGGEIAGRVRMQHQIMVVAVALAGASGTFVPRLLRDNAPSGVGDLVLSLLALLFMAFAVVFIEHDVQIAIAGRFRATNLRAFNNRAFGTPTDAWERYRGEKYTAFPANVVAFLLTIARYFVTAGIAVAALVGRAVRADGVPPFRGDYMPAEVVALACFWLLLFAFGAGVVLATWHFNRAGALRP